MSNTIYIIDSSALIDLKNSYPIKNNSHLWKKIEKICKEGKLIAPMEVYKEIKNGSDELVEWIDKISFIFIPHEDIILNRKFQKVMSEFPQVHDDKKKKYDADPWIIALALYKIEEENDKLPALRNEYIVVTSESIKNRLIKACEYFRLNYVNLTDFLKREKIIVSP